VHSSNPRTLRVNPSIAENIFGVLKDGKYQGGYGWNPKTDQVTGAIDMPVMVRNGKRFDIVRGAGRIGTLANWLTSDDAERKRTAMAMVASGVIKAIVVDGADTKKLVDIANDNDTLKEAWNRPALYRAYQKRRATGDSQAEACKAIGYTNRLLSFTWLDDVGAKVRNAWFDYHECTDAEAKAKLPPVRDAHLRSLAEIVRKARTDAGKDMLAAEKIPAYVEKEKEILSGKVDVAPKPLPDSKLKNICTTLRNCRGKVSTETVAKMLLASRCIGEDGSAVPQNSLGLMVNELLESDTKSQQKEKAG
jgi:hypothetical protein